MGVFGEVSNLAKFVNAGAAQDGVKGIAKGAAKGFKLGGGEMMDRSSIDMIYKHMGDVSAARKNLVTKGIPAKNIGKMAGGVGGGMLYNSFKK